MDASAPSDRDSNYAAIAAGTHGDPFSVLGPHGEVARAFLPQAQRAWIVTTDGETVAEMSRVHGDGLYEGPIGGLSRDGYRYAIETAGRRRILDDPYRFGFVLGELDVHLLAEGRHLRAFDALGGRPAVIDGVAGARFAVWAPNARRVSVVGDFNAWDGRRHAMRLRRECGVWELFIPGLSEGAAYKYELLGADGRLLPLKADPFAFAMETRPATASLLRAPPDPPDPAETDPDEARRSAPNAPMSIYEVHLGSWMRGEDGGFLSYDALGDRLIPYALSMGFTHLEFLPVSEHPFDGSWGYQPIGLFAPTSRHGAPEAFARLVSRCQAAGLGVMLDWVPGHFPNDPHGLARFDGTHLYEHADPRQGFHQDWNTLIYNFGRAEVRNFLIASALFWLERYGVDGLRVDAVASMLYLDYSRREGEWIPNRHGGRENLDAVDFLRDVNERVRATRLGAVTAAEESTAWPGVSRPVAEGGLGFDYKWNMGWMHDTLSYMARDPVHRRYHHHEMTFGLVYAFSERFILPLSHDEVVHGKGSLLGKMPGDPWRRFANLRAYYGFMWAHPGKKLLFMGGEIAQEREWSHDRAIDWGLLDRPEHRGVQRLIRDLNRLYTSEPALHRRDADPEGFQWVIDDDRDNSVFAFLRCGGPDDRPALAVANMTPQILENYRVGAPSGGEWTCLLSTDDTAYGGTGLGRRSVQAEQIPWNDQPYSLKTTLPPLATIILAPAANRN